MPAEALKSVTWSKTHYVHGLIMQPKMTEWLEGLTSDCSQCRIKIMIICKHHSIPEFFIFIKKDFGYFSSRIFIYKTSIILLKQMTGFKSLLVNMTTIDLH